VEARRFDYRYFLLQPFEHTLVDAGRFDAAKKEMAER
jgi:hypothetical protein